MAHIFLVDLKNEPFSYDMAHAALVLAELMEGNTAKPINGISRLSEIHNLEALDMKKPNQPQQLSLL